MQKAKKTYLRAPRVNGELKGKPINRKVSKCDLCREAAIGCKKLNAGCEDFWPEGPGMSTNFTAVQMTVEKSR